jgi:hypothetical protein
MWPWEHLVFGYLLYSVGKRAVRGESPMEHETYALALATQLPDLIDKPLAWTFDVLPSGISLAHSLTFAVPCCLLIGAFASRLSMPTAGISFGVGYGSHLVGDSLYPLFTGGEAATTFLFWPFISRQPIERTAFLAEASRLFADFQTFLATPRGQAYLLIECIVVALVLALWTWDGRPGTGFLKSPREVLRRVRS